MVRALSVYCMVEVAGDFGTCKLGVGKIAVAFIPGLSEIANSKLVLAYQIKA